MTPTLTLGCGPYFNEVGAYASLAALLVVKPITYFAFIQAFRYRVSRAVPMSLRRAAGLTAARTVAGVLLLGLPYFVLQNAAGIMDWRFAWGLLATERLILWLLLGMYVQLRGRRLLGWTLSGTGIDLAYDVTVGSSLAVGFWPHILLIVGLIAFLVPLTIIGRRQSLKLRFAQHPHCAKCGYNLTGNLSGSCPECGTPVAQSVAAVG